LRTNQRAFSLQVSQISGFAGTFRLRVSQPPNPLLEDTALREPVFERLKGLSKNEILVLVAAALLVLDLFGTWQTLQVDFGPAGTATSLLDGWDAWGLLIALGSIGLITVVIVVYASEIEISQDVRWELWIFVGAAALFAATLVKSLTDADSAWASYVGVVLAAIVLAGAFRNWSATRRRQRRRLRRRTRSSPGPS
jgi:hypothetical protein